LCRTLHGIGICSTKLCKLKIPSGKMKT
jgi:hypothetical protein